MGLETFNNYIKTLDTSNPDGADNRSQGDDHIRGIKSTIKGQFSGIAGMGTPAQVTADADDLNFLDGSTAGTAVASKALVVDANKDLTGLNDLTVGGDLTVTGDITGIVDTIYPVGAIFTTVTAYANSAAVVAAIGGTTWVAFGAGKVLVGVDSGDTDFDTVEETGGSKTHTLTTAEMPAHTHTHSTPSYQNQFVHGSGATADRSPGGSGSTGSTGSGDAHNNVQPYITVYMWKRTA